MKIFVAILSLAIAPTIASAACWKVGDMKGTSARAHESYVTGPDGYSGQVFEISISGAEGFIEPSNLKCQRATSTSLLCADASGDKMTVETWSVDTTNKKVVHTKSRSGHGSLDGGNLFIGNVLGSCSGG